MTGVKFESFGGAYQELVRMVRTHGVDAAPRGHKVTELRWPHVWHITKPQRWSLMIPGRRFNPFFALAEVIWMWSGKGGADFITFYNKSIGQFLDDGIPYFHGAYGRRVRQYGYDESQFRHIPSTRTMPGSGGSIPVVVDQAAHVIRKIQGDRDTRQAVIMLWDPIKDNLVSSKDHPCLGGDTVLYSPEGRIALKDLAKKFSSGQVTRWPVMSFDPSTKLQTLAWCDKVWKTGNKPTIKMHFDDGTFVVTTINHKFFLKKYRDKQTCSEIEAGCLKVGDRVWASAIWPDPKGHLVCEKTLGSRAGANVHTIHKAYSVLVDGPVPKGVDVHHKDKVKTNNSYQNLERLSTVEHGRISMKEQGLNPMLKLTPEQHKARATKQSVSLTKNWAKRKQETNHVIVKIEDMGTQDVFDFSVPGLHNARLECGVFTHNCNNTVYFQQRDGALNMTVVRRSNDLILGVPYNMCQFVHLQALIAGALGVQMGHYSVMANNLHYYHELYPDTLDLVDDWAFNIPNSHVSLVHGDLTWDMEWDLSQFDVFVREVWEPFEKASRVKLDQNPGVRLDPFYEMQRIMLQSQMLTKNIPAYWQHVFTTLLAYHAYKGLAWDVFTDVFSELPRSFQWQIMDFWNTPKHPVIQKLREVPMMQALIDEVAHD